MTIELVKSQNDVADGAMCLVNRGILREFLNEAGYQVDYEEAAKLHPDDVDIARRHALTLVQRRQYDDAIVQARASHASSPSADTALFLAAALSERAKDGDI